MPEITIKLNVHDLWIGVYWVYSKSVESPSRWLTIYICIVPMLVIKLYWHWGWKR